MPTMSASFGVSVPLALNVPLCVSWRMDRATYCDRCKRPLIEVEHYGERLIGCITCNRWSWPGSEDLFMSLPEEDLHALRRARGLEGEE